MSILSKMTVKDVQNAVDSTFLYTFKEEES